MKKILLLTLLLGIGTTVSCGSTKKAVLSVNKSSIKLSMTVSGDYAFTGYVDNTGDKDAYGALVSITYKTLNGFTEEASASTYDIKAGSDAAFKIVIKYDIPTTWTKASCIELFA